MTDAHLEGGRGVTKLSVGLKITGQTEEQMHSFQHPTGLRAGAWRHPILMTPDLAHFLYPGPHGGWEEGPVLANLSQ